jgi:hypothetical protein
VTKTTVEIVDESTDEVERLVLHVGTARNVASVQAKHGDVKINFGIYGPIYLDEAKAVIAGIFELTVHAEAIRNRIEHEKRSGVRRSAKAHLSRRRSKQD